ncbi:MAG: membrane integrity-associated transporter subunit PqiC [Verrucomicrobiales bacterium]|nr:membrane integrity-associated transporter subunit PqiC [Verrucomicrobiales bacterium]
MLRTLTLLSSGAMAGCRIQRAPLVQRTFRLQLPIPAVGARASETAGAVLLVRPFHVVAAADSRSFLIRRGEAEFTVDAYNGFVQSPGSMFAEAMADWVRGLGSYRLVSTGGSQVVPTYFLEGEVQELWGDYRVADSPKAVLSVAVRLLHPRSGEPMKVEWEQAERREVVMAKAEPDALVAGWNRALEEIAKALEERMRPSG